MPEPTPAIAVAGVALLAWTVLSSWVINGPTSWHTWYYLGNFSVCAVVVILRAWCVLP